MTLIELLVAMCLLAILSVLGYKAFSALLVTRERLMEVSSRWIGLSRTFAQLGDEVVASSDIQLDERPDGQWLKLSRPETSPDGGRDSVVYRAGAGGLTWASSRTGAAAFPVLGAEYRVVWSVRLADGGETSHWRQGAPGRPVALEMRVSGPLVGSVRRQWFLP
jgi:general secretion pathway protein J